MDLQTFVEKQNEIIDEARLEGLLRAFEKGNTRKKSWLRHIDIERVRKIVNRGHIHLNMPFGSRTPWWSGKVLDEKDHIHNIQITYYHQDFNKPEGAFCWDCNGYCEAAVAALLVHMAKRGPLPKPDEKQALTKCPICEGSL